MLYIRFGPSENAIEPVSVYFRNVYERVWFDDPLVREIIRDVDKSEVIAGTAIDSPVLGVISPMELSGGVKTLILALFLPENEYYGTACGDNCGKWFIEIGKRQDIHITLDYIMKFRSPEDADVGGMNAICVNNNMPIDNMRDFINAYTAYKHSLGGV